MAHDPRLDRQVIHQFVPLDVPAWAERFLAHWQPDAACFVESELWPNLLAACRRRSIPTALVNARLSTRSARSWARVPGLARSLLAGFAFISAQSTDDAARLRALGAPEVACWGNLKLAADPLPAEPSDIAELTPLLAGRPVWLAASTHPSDDDIVAAAQAALLPRHPDLLTVLAPRHPDRGEALAAQFDAPRRSRGQPPPIQGGAWIADTIGDMGLLYRCIPVVLMGKGFAGGGQNPWEPAQLGCAIATGPDTSNFVGCGCQIAYRGSPAGGERRPRPHRLARQDAVQPGSPGRSACSRPPDDTGGERPSRPPRPPPGRADATRMNPPDFWQHGGARLPATLLAPLACAVTRASAARMAKTGWPAPVPVICCGNATVGGSGKTTLALDLIARLQRRGVAAHCLTRGHGGRLRGPLRVQPGLHDAQDVGDEALLLAACAPTWRGADRAASAREAVAAGAEALIMDDGLQNTTLNKTLSLLVVDGETGWGNGAVLPAGPLREPVKTAASRCAAAVMIGHDRTNAIASLPGALPVLEAKLRPGSDTLTLAGRSVLAVAGIGRPEKFFTMLEQAGITVAQRIAFPDHHRFTPTDLANIEGQASALGVQVVTTFKDFVRLPADKRPGFQPLGVGLHWQDETRIDTLLGHAMAEGSTR